MTSPCVNVALGASDWDVIQGAAARFGFEVPSGRGPVVAVPLHQLAALLACADAVNPELWRRIRDSVGHRAHELYMQHAAKALDEDSDRGWLQTMSELEDCLGPLLDVP
jgi:hypothetical protein